MYSLVLLRVSTSASIINVHILEAIENLVLSQRQRYTFKDVVHMYNM